MKTVQHLMNRYNKAAAALDEAKSELAPRLKEILQAMGEKVGRGDGLEECYISNSAVHCTFGYTVRGCYDRDSYTIPASIMNATDPVEAATSALEQKNAKQAEVTRQQKLAQLEQLKKELQQ